MLEKEPSSPSQAQSFHRLGRDGSLLPPWLHVVAHVDEKIAGRNE
jgi:hypothetical protein